MPSKFQYVINCVGATAEFIHYIVDNNRPEDVGRPIRSKEVSLATFRKHCDLSPFKGEIDFAHDWAVSYYRSVAPSGTPIFFFQWSHIEHVFWPPGVPFDLDRESELARASEDVDNAAWDRIQAQRQGVGTAWHFDGLAGDLIHFPEQELLNDIELLRAEKKWVKAMQTKGAWVVVQGPVDDPDIIGRIVTPTFDPVNGERMVLVEHELFERTSQGELVPIEGGTVQRWYSVFRLAPYQVPGKVVKFPR